MVQALGEGSQGETFEAYDTVRGKRVAIKRFRVSTAKAWKDVELAEREVKTLASLEHELLPRYLEHFEEEGALVLVMDHVDGESLATIKAKGRSSVLEIERFLADASRALDYLHGRAPPIIHRDIKPANVIRRKEGTYVLVDFGAVRDRLKPEGGSTVVGTFGYMAPEQFQGRAAPATDVYGVGATALALLTGQEPESLPHKGLGIDVAAALPASIEPSLVRTLEAMLEPDPEKRAPSIKEALRRGGLKSERPPASKRRDARRAEHEARRESRRAKRESRRAHRHGPPRAVPFLPRMFANVGLLVAWLAIMLTVGMLVPALLYLLSVLFGAALRRAAQACLRAARRAGSAIGRASDRMAGIDVDAMHRPQGVRVAEDVLQKVRAVTPEQAQAEAIRLQDLATDDAEAWADEVATREAEKWAAEEDERDFQEKLARSKRR